LIKAGLDLANAAEWEDVVVLDSPDYYTRFGFKVALVEDFKFKYSGPHLMALALLEKGLPELIARISYAPAFNNLG